MKRASQFLSSSCREQTAELPPISPREPTVRGDERRDHERGRPEVRRLYESEDLWVTRGDDRDGEERWVLLLVEPGAARGSGGGGGSGARASIAHTSAEEAGGCVFEWEIGTDGERHDRDLEVDPIPGEREIEREYPKGECGANSDAVKREVTLEEPLSDRGHHRRLGRGE